MKFAKFRKSGGREVWVAIDDICTIEPSESYPEDTAAITFRGDSKSVMHLCDRYVDVVNCVVHGVNKKTIPSR